MKHQDGKAMWVITNLSKDEHQASKAEAQMMVEEPDPAVQAALCRSIQNT